MQPIANVFATVPRTNHLGLFRPDHPDWKKTVEFLDLKKRDVARATGVPMDSIRFDERIPDELRARLTEIATICELVAQAFDGDIRKTALWFQVSNPAFGNVSPRAMIRVGRYQKVLRLVLDASAAERRANEP